MTLKIVHDWLSSFMVIDKFNNIKLYFVLDINPNIVKIELFYNIISNDK